MESMINGLWDLISSMCCMFVLAKKVGKWHSKQIYTNNYKYTAFKLHNQRGEQNQSSSIISPFFIVGIHIFLCSSNWMQIDEISSPKRKKTHVAHKQAIFRAAHNKPLHQVFNHKNRSILHWTLGHGGLQAMGWIGPTGASSVIVKQGWQNGDSKTSEKVSF